MCWTFYSLQNFKCFKTLKLFNIINDMLKSFDYGKKWYIWEHSQLLFYMWISGQHSNYLNILIRTSAETSTVIIKCGFCVKIVILQLNKCLCHFYELQKKTIKNSLKRHRLRPKHVSVTIKNWLAYKKCAIAVGK